jgi:hypothetical protein
MAYLYSAYGLTLRTPFLCKWLIEAGSGAAADVEVVEGSVPGTLPHPAMREADRDAAPGSLLLEGGRRSARFLVEDGTRITFARNADCEEDLLRHDLLRGVMAAILRRRQIVVLHASCAVDGAKAVILAGPSGAGKSTTMAALVTRGWRMVSDDVLALRLNDHGRIEALPGPIHVRLDGAAATLPVNTSGLTRSEWHRRKMALPLGDRRDTTPGVVSKLVRVEKTAASGLRVAPVTGREKLSLLLRSLYRPTAPGEIAARFDLFAAALKDVTVLSVARPHDAWTLNEIVEAVSHG